MDWWVGAAAGSANKDLCGLAGHGSVTKDLAGGGGEGGTGLRLKTPVRSPVCAALSSSSMGEGGGVLLNAPEHNGYKLITGGKLYF